MRSLVAALLSNAYNRHATLTGAEGSLVIPAGFKPVVSGEQPDRSVRFRSVPANRLLSPRLCGFPAIALRASLPSPIDVSPESGVAKEAHVSPFASVVPSTERVGERVGQCEPCRQR